MIYFSEYSALKIKYKISRGDPPVPARRKEMEELYEKEDGNEDEREERKRDEKEMEGWYKGVDEEEEEFPATTRQARFRRSQ